jgi:beta-fructofuranosidase
METAICPMLCLVATLWVLCACVLASEPPTDGLVLHLDASRSGAEIDEGPVARWQDLSGCGHDVAQADAGARPTLVGGAVNGLAAVRFSGSSHLDGPPVLPEGCRTLTIAAVWRRQDANGVQVICEQADGGVGRRASLLTVNSSYGFNGQNNDEHGLVEYRGGLWNLSVLTVDDSGVVRLWHNDSRGGTGARGQISRTVQNTGARMFRLGSKITSGDECLQGDVAEVLVYDRVLRFAEVQGVNGYLGEKWAIGKAGADQKWSVETMTLERMDQGPDYTSKVPQYAFAGTLAEQEQQLRDNPLLARFRESRARLAADPYRPLYHFVSPESSLNDPNGLCLWQGRWHLFYQGYPPEDPRQHWGHAVSDDLIHWRDLPYAIYPNPEECCYSGATFVEQDRVIAMYHGTKVGNMVAVSGDPLLLNWEKVTGGAVIPLRQADGTPQPFGVFDPCVWKEGDWYYSLSAGTIAGPGNQRVRADFVLRSKDLATWEYLHPLVEYDPYTLVGDDGACPYFWPIGDRHILLHFSHMSGGKYLLGRYDTEAQRLVVTGGGSFNFGPAWPAGVHAPSATPDGKGGVVVIFNMNSAKPTPGWNQIMSLPRRLTLSAEGDLLQEPAGDFASLRGEHESVGETALRANQEVVLERIRGNSLELMAEIDPKGAPTLELKVLRSPGEEEYTRLSIYPNRGFHYRARGGRPGQDTVVSLDISHASSLPDVTSRPPETAPVYIPEGEPARLHVFVDRSIVEVFVNGRQCVAARVYPGRADSVGVSLRAIGRDALLRSLDAWTMGSIYEAGGGG